MVPSQTLRVRRDCCCDLLTHLFTGPARLWRHSRKYRQREIAHRRCEILEDFGLNVPDTTTGTVGAWHTYSKGQNLDYRQDNNYIVLYVQKLGCMLISAARTAWNSWNPKRGRYLVATSRGGGGGEVGHMIGVTVDADGDKTITDRQELSPGTGSNAENYDNFYVTYVFKAP